MPVKIISYIVGNVQNLLTWTGTTYRVVTLNEARASAVFGELTSPGKLAILKSKMSQNFGRQLTKDEVISFIRGNPFEAVVLLYTLADVATTVASEAKDLFESLKTDLFDVSNDEVTGVFTNYNSQSGITKLNDIGNPFGVAPRFQTIASTTLAEDDLTSLPCVCSGYEVVINDKPFVVDAVITIEKDAGCFLSPRSDCEVFATHLADSRDTLTLCESYRIFAKTFGYRPKEAASVIASLQILLKDN